ncbi:MAG: exonuclease domain-containing protein [Planctomycetaceae bacterium]
MDFIAIDFETANQRRDSACQLAAVVVQNGEIVDRQMWMIRPRPFFFSPWNIQVHGIQPHQVADEPEFGELWPTMARHLQNACLVAHNAPFDIGVLMACIRAHDHTVPEIEFTCTRLIARAAWPGRSGYGLKPIANWLGIDFRHHDALEDSVACARILLAAAAHTGAQSLEELESELKLSRGLADNHIYQGAKKAARARVSRPRSRAFDATPLRADSNADHSDTTNPATDPPISKPELDLQRLFIRAEFLQRLSGKQVVFSGPLKWLSQENAEQLARKLGASIERQVTLQTDYVIFGETHDAAIGDSIASSQPLPAFNLAGRPINRLSEHDFIGLVQCTDTVTLS